MGSTAGLGVAHRDIPQPKPWLAVGRSDFNWASRSLHQHQPALHRRAARSHPRDRRGRAVRRRRPQLPPLRPVDASPRDPAGGGHPAVALGHYRVIVSGLVDGEVPGPVSQLAVRYLRKALAWCASPCTTMCHPFPPRLSLSLARDQRIHRLASWPGHMSSWDALLAAWDEGVFTVIWPGLRLPLQGLRAVVR